MASVTLSGLQGLLPLFSNWTCPNDQLKQRKKQVGHFENRRVCSDSLRFMWQQKQQTQQPLITGVRRTPRSPLSTCACSTSSAGAPPQIILSTTVCLCAVFHYPASVSTSPSNWPHLNMPRHHLLLNGPLWSKCQTGKVLKKKCPHLLSWHFPQRPFLLPPYTPCLLVAGVSTKGPVLPSRSTNLLCACACACILTHLYPHFESEMNNPIDIAAMFT